MNKQLHLNPPTPGGPESVDINSLTENGSHASLFQPKGLVQFETAWNWQIEWREKIFRDDSCSQGIWMLEHSPCYTIGRGGDRKNLLFDINKTPSDFFCIDRGGDATYHSPGQLVVYLVLDLRRYNTDLHWYLRELEQVIIDFLSALDIKGERVYGLTGVWSKGLKIASIGVGCRRWITQHGFALNINCDLKGFKKILPCGLNSSKVGKLNDLIPGLTIEESKSLIKQCLSDRFGFNWSH